MIGLQGTAGAFMKSERVGNDSAARDTFGLVGRLVDSRYLVERVVGSGGYGVVYRAHQLRLDAPVALKVLRIPETFSSEQRASFIARFLQEGKLLFQLGSLHPALVRVLEAGTLLNERGDMTPFLAMDWLAGRSLDAVSRELRETEHRLTLGEVLALLYPLAEGLGMLHERGVVHRDIKPGNIFLQDQGSRISPRLLDFGLAKIMQPTLDGSGWSVGVELGRQGLTPAYAAPEQWAHELGPTGPWTDVHALALVASELLTAKRALRAISTHELKLACLSGERPTPRRQGADLSADAEAAFARALSIDPRSRYDNPLTFWRALARAEGIRPARGFSVSVDLIRPHSLDRARQDDRAPVDQTSLSLTFRSQELGSVARPSKYKRGPAQLAAAGVFLAGLIGLATGSPARGPLASGTVAVHPRSLVAAAATRVVSEQSAPPTTEPAAAAPDRAKLEPTRPAPRAARPARSPEPRATAPLVEPARPDTNAAHISGKVEPLPAASSTTSPPARAMSSWALELLNTDALRKRD